MGRQRSVGQVVEWGRGKVGVRMPQRPAEKPKPKPKPPAVPSAVAAGGDLKPVPLGRSSDEDLMKRTQLGDKSAFEILYERYSQSVLSYLYRMLGNLEDVES